VLSLPKKYLLIHLQKDRVVLLLFLMLSSSWLIVFVFKNLVLDN
jgi:hypothetical protein